MARDITAINKLAELISVVWQRYLTERADKCGRKTTQTTINSVLVIHFC